jgi:hypothetical protein
MIRLLVGLANDITFTGVPTGPMANEATITKLVGIVFGILGAVAVLMIVVAGFRYIVSAGDPQSTAKAKNGIIYACIGLVISIAAEVIVQFVAGRIGAL